VTKRSAGVRTLRAGVLGIVVLALGAWAWHAVEDARLRRAFGEALERRVDEAAPVARDGVDADGATLRLSLVTYNVWALPVPLPGMDRLRRLPRIPAALAGFSPDLVLLQEAFDVRMRVFVVAYLRGYQGGPDDLCREPMVPLGEKDCTGGLMTLSRLPVTASRFYVHPVGEVDSGPLQRAHIGSCTGAKFEDLRAAARVLKGRRIARGLQLLVAPASKAILNKALAEGVLQPLLDAGGVLMPTTCGICAGKGPGQLGPGEACVSSANRNYPGRMGSKEASIYLASAATVAASALRGRVTDPREFL